MTIESKRMWRGWWRVSAFIAILVLTPRVGFGQEPARSFAQLKRLATSGDRVTVIDTAGASAAGTVIRITDADLAVELDGSPRNRTPSQVRQVRRRMGDSVLNGMLIGAAVGAGTGSLSYLDNECREKSGCAAGLFMGTAIFAGIGAAIDALIRSDRVIYNAPTDSHISRTRVTVLAGKERAALQFIVRF